MVSMAVTSKSDIKCKLLAFQGKLGDINKVVASPNSP
jgi:hypothetical protein